MVLLRLRGRDEVGSTFLQVIKRYASRLKANHGKLILVGVSEQVYIQLEKTGLLEDLGSQNVYCATKIIGNSALTALEDARQWLESPQIADPAEV